MSTEHCSLPSADALGKFKTDFFACRPPALCVTVYGQDNEMWNVEDLWPRASLSLLHSGQ